MPAVFSTRSTIPEFPEEMNTDAVGIAFTVWVGMRSLPTIFLPVSVLTLSPLSVPALPGRSPLHPNCTFESSTIATVPKRSACGVASRISSSC